MRGRSVRAALLAWLLPSAVLLVPCGALLAYRVALLPALDSLDRALLDTAVALEQLIEHRGAEVALPITEQTARALRADVADHTEFAVLDPRGRLLTGSPALAALAEPVAAGAWSFGTATLGGRTVRVASHGAECGSVAPCRIVVSETTHKRDAARAAALEAAVLGALAIGLPLIGLTLLAVDRALVPLRRAALDVEASTPTALGRVDVDAMPGEVAGFVRALNGLLDRLEAARDAQRAFVADAAHQLRTPLAIVRVEVDELLRESQAAHEERLQRLAAASARAARLVQQLLALATTEGLAATSVEGAPRVELSALAAREGQAWLRAAWQNGQEIEFELAPAWVAGRPELLGELVSNLLDNAVRHAGRGARIVIGTDLAGPTARLWVEDDGPGVPQDERATLWARFRRGRAAGGEGSGLGLAIVRDIARLHGGDAVFANSRSGHGLRVEVRLPRASAAHPVSNGGAR